MDKVARRKCAEVQRALFQIFLIMDGVTGLKNLAINVPAVASSGDTVTLSCHYDLEGLSLYRIQWYLEEAEFYRYLPERDPPYTTFNIDGVHVNVSKSNAFDVTLMDVSRKMSGMYKCEVSAGSPSYHTLIEKSFMQVVDAPRTDPIIDTEKERISVGEVFRANCTTGNSRPAPAITWKLNGDLIANNSMIYTTTYLVIPQEDNTLVSKSIIDFKITEDMFRNGRLYLLCTASIADVYRKSAHIEITEDTPRIASIKEESPPQGFSNSSVCLRSTRISTVMTILSLFAILLPSSMRITVTSK